MRVSVFLDHLRDIASQKGCTLAAAMKEAKKSGVDYVEVNAGTIANPEDFMRLLGQTGLEVGGLYSFFDFGHKDQPDEIRSTAEMAEKLKAHIILAIPGYFEEGDDHEAVRERMAASLDTLCTEAAIRGLHTTIEDFDSDRVPYGTAEEVMWFLERIPRLGCTFDTGNFLYHGQDVLKAYDLLEPRIQHVHMKDRGYRGMAGEEPVISVKGRKLYAAPVGSGELPMAEIVRRLYERGYDGICAMEHFGARDQLLYMRRSARWMKNIFR